MEEITKREDNYIDIYPIGKGRRFLVFFCDFFISFMISVFLFNVAVHPIVGAIGNKNEINNKIQEAENKKIDILLGHKILQYEDEKFKYDFYTDFTYTFTQFAKYFIAEGSSDGDIFHTFFVDVRGKSYDEYVAFMKTVDEPYGYFNFQSGQPVLEERYVELFYPAFDPKDKLSENGQIAFNAFRDNFFLQGYYKVISDIETNDLSYNGFSYNALTKNINEYSKSLDNLIVISSFVSFFLGCIATYLIYPLINKHSRTPTMSVFKLERIGINNLYTLKKREIFISFIYNTISNFPYLMFLPMLVVSFNYLFNLGQLLFLSLITILLLIVSLFFLIFDRFNRTLIDIGSKSLLVTQEELDKIYSKKGYKI